MLAAVVALAGADTDHDWLIETSTNDIAEVVETCWNWIDDASGKVSKMLR